jgi:hypothetical protein
MTQGMLAGMKTQERAVQATHPQLGNPHLLYRAIGLVLDSIHHLACGRQKTTTVRRLDLSPSSGGWGRINVVVFCLPHTRRWIESKTSPIALYNIHHRQNPFKSTSPVNSRLQNPWHPFKTFEPPSTGRKQWHFQIWSMALSSANKPSALASIITVDKGVALFIYASFTEPASFLVFS